MNKDIKADEKHFLFCYLIIINVCEILYLQIFLCTVDYNVGVGVNKLFNVMKSNSLVFIQYSNTFLMYWKQNCKTENMLGKLIHGQ